MPKILTREGDPASIPCLATDPNLSNLSLETCSRGPLAFGLQFTANLEQGILIHNTRKAYGGCYRCTGTLQRQTVESNEYELTVRPGKTKSIVHFLLCFRHVFFWKCKCLHVLQCLMSLPWWRCISQRKWFWRAARLCLSPATPLMSMEISPWGGSSHLARWDPYVSSWRCALQLIITKCWHSQKHASPGSRVLSL